jgi:proteasome lid subunit RPN8/RPN11
METTRNPTSSSSAKTADVPERHLDATEMKLRQPVEKLIPTKDPARRVKPVNLQAESDMPIFVLEKVLKEIIAYSRTDKDQELGGVLVGGYYRWEGRDYIEIDGYLAARLGQGRSASFTFTHEAWHDIHQRLGDTDERLLVGWHHTHPTFGCFLSGHDRFIQDNFFDLPWQVALVVDPCRNTLAFFQWSNADVKDCGFYIVVK